MTIENALDLANSFEEAGNLTKAESLYRQILVHHPAHPEALHRLGLLAAQTNRNSDAVTLLEQAVAQAPDQAGYRANLGEIYRRLGRFDEAIACLCKAVENGSPFPQTYINLGAALTATRQFERATGQYQQALAMDPNSPAGHLNLGLSFAELTRFDEAIACCRRALTLAPHAAEAHNAFGAVLLRMGEIAKAFPHLERAVSLNGNFADAHINLGSAYRDLGNWERSIFHYTRALSITPDHADAHAHWVSVLAATGRLDEAVEQTRNFVRQHPNSATAHWMLAVMLLRAGLHEEGWKEYEWRWKCPSFPGSGRKFSAPRWTGGPVRGQTIFVHSEQGLGDSIQFIRYLPLVRTASQADHIIFECPPALIRLIAGTNIWNAQIVESDSGSHPITTGYGRHIPLTSLPGALGLPDPGDPAVSHGPYLRTDPQLCATWRERLGPRHRLRVGLAWAGNPAFEDDYRRSIPLATLEPFLSLPDISFHNLQIDRRGLDSSPSFKGHLLDSCDEIADFADTAALITELDLVISADTAVAHLTGALGRPIWLLLPFLPDWRWGLGRFETPWYPTMRLFRQPKPGDWTTVVSQVTHELRLTVNASS